MSALIICGLSHDWSAVASAILNGLHRVEIEIPELTKGLQPGTIPGTSPGKLENLSIRLAVENM
jgi:hypothetical protein